MKIKLIALSKPLNSLGAFTTFRDPEYIITISKELQMVKIHHIKSTKSAYTHLSNVHELIIEETTDKK